MPSQLPAFMSADELLATRLPGRSTELVRGVLVVREPPGTRHGVIAGKLAYFIADHAFRHSLGVVCAQDTGFLVRTDPDTVRAPDVAFVRQQRVPMIPATGYAPFAPDLAVEIVSPGDTQGEVLAKVGDWLDAGAALVWVIYPARDFAQVYGPAGSVAFVPADGALDGADVLPGFRRTLRELLA